MVLTGVSLACALGCKINGVIAFLPIGTAVLVDLWGILDIKKGHSMVRSTLFLWSPSPDCIKQDYFWKHFVARAIGLILVPIIVYLSFFYVHFALLPKSGTGDNFMSPAFQETLRGNEMLLNSQGLFSLNDMLLSSSSNSGR